ncbi:MAG: DNA polymerase, partial [Deltaproteobacteria bacterium]|nr:DNA polymerase [Deltaproteobacteria bacterium]
YRYLYLASFVFGICFTNHQTLLIATMGIEVLILMAHRRLGREKLATKLLLQIHDELVLEVPAKELEAVKALVKEEMEGVTKLTIPLKVDVGVGKNWAEAH